MSQSKYVVVVDTAIRHKHLTLLIELSVFSSQLITDLKFILHCRHNALLIAVAGRTKRLGEGTPNRSPLERSLNF